MFLHCVSFAIPHSGDSLLLLTHDTLCLHLLPLRTSLSPVIPSRCRHPMSFE